MKLVEGGYYRDKRTKHRSIMRVSRIEKKLAWGNIYFVDENEPCALHNCGIDKSRLVEADQQSFMDAKAMHAQIQAEGWGVGE